MPSPTMAEILRNPEKYRQQAEQMGDIEFQMEIAKRLRNKGPIDPRAARIQPEGDGNLMGFSVDADPEKGNTNEFMSGNARIRPERGTVNVMGGENATPRIWAHEYRHQQGLSNEYANRLEDLVNAPIHEREAIADEIRKFEDTDATTDELLMTADYFEQMRNQTVEVIDGVTYKGFDFE